MIALSDALALRETSAWGSWEDVQVIPVRYGRTTGACVPYLGRRVWVWADHASAAVESVRVDGEPVQGWAWRNDVDIVGRPVTIVEFVQPLADTAQVQATGTGKLRADQAGPIDNPADVLADILFDIAGRPDQRVKLQRFRRECDVAGLRCAGSIDAAGSVQAWAVKVCASVGAVWAPAARDIARLWPLGTTDSYAPAIVDTGDISAAADIDSIVTLLTLRYDVVDGQAREVVQYRAPIATALFGVREQVVDTPFVGDGRVAALVAERLLRWRATRRWSISGARVEALVAAGETVTVAHPALLVAGPMLALASQRDPWTRDSTVAGELAAEALAVVELVRNDIDTTPPPPPPIAEALTDNDGVRLVDNRGDALTDN